MAHKIIDGFHFADWGSIGGQQAQAQAQGGAATDAEKYEKVVRWAGEARGQNPTVFDKLTEWILDDSEWGEDKLAENEQILMHGVFARFRDQNGKLRAYLKGLEPSGVVNPAVFAALDRFDDELSGKPHDERLRGTVAKVFADFASMRDRGVRELFAGNKTGPEGVNYVDLFGYVNYLKDCDAAIQWALFMPEMVERQQDGFKMDSIEYKKMPAMRFIGKECVEHGEADMGWELGIMRELDSMAEHKSDIGYDVLFQHHYGKCVDVERWHGFWGRFMKAGAPVPDGFLHFDFVPDRGGCGEGGGFNAGPPYLSQFAYAVFSGDMAAMHKSEGYDSDAMYDVTRNTMLGQGVNIPYPDKYWTAEVFPDGCDKYSTAYMFSAEL